MIVERGLSISQNSTDLFRLAHGGKRLATRLHYTVRLSFFFCVPCKAIRGQIYLLIALKNPRSSFESLQHFY